MPTRKPRSQPYRVSWPLNSEQASNIDEMFQILFDDIRNGALDVATTQISGIVGVTQGGTGITSYSIGDLIYASAATTLSALAIGTAGKVLRSTGTLPAWSAWTTPTNFVQGDIIYASAGNTLSALSKDTNATRYLSNTGTNNNPAWAQVDLTNGVTGDLPFANLTPATTGSILLGRGDSGAGDFQEITLGTGLTMTGTVLASSSSSGAYAPLTNGDPVFPELVFDSFGDVIMVPFTP